MSEIYLPESCFKNILNFCGEPLPKDEYFFTYNSRITRKYFREENGKIKYKNIQMVIKCKRCETDYEDTGYQYCSACYGVFKNDRYVKKGVCLIDSDDDEF